MKVKIKSPRSAGALHQLSRLICIWYNPKLLARKTKQIKSRGRSVQTSLSLVMSKGHVHTSTLTDHPLIGATRVCFWLWRRLRRSFTHCETRNSAQWSMVEEYLSVSTSGTAMGAAKTVAARARTVMTVKKRMV